MIALRPHLKTPLALGLGLCLATGAAGQKLPETIDTADKLGGVGAVEESPVRDLGAAYDVALREIRDGFHASPKIGGVRAETRVPLRVSPLVRVPLLKWGVRPEDAEIKLGRFYLDFRSVTVSLLASDNANHSENAPVSGVIGIISTEMASILQINDALQLGMAARLYYLPFRGEFGFGNRYGEMDYGFALQPLFDTRLTYTAMLAGWQVNFYDRFSAHYVDFGSKDGFAVFDDNAVAAEDQLGRYHFGTDPRLTGRRTPLQRDGRQSVALVNTLGFYIDRMLPTETHLTLGFAHDNYWYDRPNTGTSTRETDRFYLHLDSEWDNARFRPFFHYEARRSDSNPEWRQSFLAGARSELTDQIDFLGEMGYTTRPRPNGGSSDSYLWDLVVTHTINASIRHGFSYSRYLRQPVERLSETMNYFYHHVLGPYLHGELVAGTHNSEDLDAPVDTRLEDWYMGARLGFTPSDRTIITAGALFTKRRRFGANDSTVDILRFRLDWKRKLSELTTLSLRYEYENWSSTVANDSFTENFGVISLTRQF